MNWKIRFKNPVFWLGIILAIVTPVLVYFNLSASDFTTWTKVFDTIKSAIANPYVVLSVITGAWNQINDSTVSGFTDSELTKSKTSVTK